MAYAYSFEDQEEWAPNLTTPAEWNIQVSTYGNIKHTGWTDSLGHFHKSRLLSTSFSVKNPYPAVCLKRNGVFRCIRLHVAVLETFVGPKPGEGYIAGHINDIPWDNHVTNLRWMTRRENAEQAIKNGDLRSSRNPERCYAEDNRMLQSKLTLEQVKGIRAGVYDHLGSTARIADFLGVKSEAINRVVAGKTWIGV